MENIIEINGLDKKFGDVHAVNDLSFKIKKGELFAFLGVNGAGKSTTISIMCGQLSKDSGEVIIDGRSIDDSLNDIKKELGVVFQNSVLDPLLTVKDNLMNKAILYGINPNEAKERIDELSEMLEFKDFLNRRLDRLSGGQRRRIDVARALLHKPNILILDEPTTGLDPQTRKTLWNVIDKLRREEEMTVLLTTHYMEEAADASYVIIIDGGKLVASGTPLQLKNSYTGDFVIVYGVSEEEVKKLNLPYTAIRDAYRIAVKDTIEARELIVKYPDLFKDFEITKGKMDDVFLSVTGKKLEGGN